MIYLNPLTTVGILGVIYFGCKRKNKHLTLMNFVIIIVLYFSLTSFNYQYIVLAIPFLTIAAIMFMRENIISILFFIAINIIATYTYSINYFLDESAFPDVSQVYSFVLIGLVLLAMAMEKDKQFRAKVLKFRRITLHIPSYSRETLVLGIVLLMIVPSTAGSFVNIASSKENQGFYDVLSEINANTNSSDYVFTSYLFPLGDSLNARQLNILDTYNNITNTYDISRLKFIIFDEFWGYYANTAQNITRLEDAVNQIANYWIELLAFPVRWATNGLSPFAPAWIYHLPEINPTLLVLYERPSLPSAPQAFTATAITHQVFLSWKAPGSNGTSAITNYTVYRGTSASNETLLITLGPVLTYTDLSVNEGTTYYYKVAAVNGNGAGANSTEQSAMPL
jgi:hypothetical protein